MSTSSEEPELPPLDLQDPVRDSLLERSLPNATEAEQAILGGILLNEALLFQAIEELEPDDFYLPSHRKIYKAMLALFAQGQPINPILIVNELKKQGDDISVTFILSLTIGLPQGLDLTLYLKLVKEKSQLRRLIKVSSANLQAAMEGEEDHEVIMARAEQRVFDLTSQRYKNRLMRAGTMLDAVFATAEANIGLGLTAHGLDSGFIELNQITSGLQKSELIIIAARPGMGKTSFAQCIINNVAIRGNKTVAFFTLEMSREAILARGLCAEARVNHDRYRKGFLTHEEWAKLQQARELIYDAPIYIDDTPAITVLELKAKSLRLQGELQRPLDLIVVDYLQLMTGNAENRRESRQQEVSGISRALKGVAKELKVPMIAVSQLSRAPEQRAEKRPQLSDLRESGALEQDADVVGFLYREAVYQTNLAEENKHLAELIIAKQRNGPPGVALLRFDGPSFRFDNLATTF